MEPTHRLASLSDVPFDDPVGIDVALRSFRPAAGRASSRRILKGLARHAIASGRLPSVVVELPDGGRATIVDGGAFDAELRALLEHGSSLGRVRGWWQGGRRHGSQSGSSRAHGPKRRLLRFLSGGPARLRVAESWFGTDDYGVDLADGSRFNPKQNRVEILALLELLASRRPRAVLEVGTSKGGTLYLFTKVAHPAARLLTVDLKQRRPKLLRGFARHDQEVEAIEADSADPATRSRVAARFPDGVDFLFLDGDHRYEGIRRDFKLYRRLVRPGGLVAFHDIVPDNRTRYGVHTGGVAGGVHLLWRELRDRYPHREFVAHPEQDGRGIGVLFMGDAPG